MENDNSHTACPYNTFQSRKLQILEKRDKSSAGKIDPRAVDICAIINGRDEYYTTSSCAGRCFLYRGKYGKGHVSSYASETEEVPLEFDRCRISHEKIHDPSRYFNLETLQEDKTGGGDAIPDHILEKWQKHTGEDEDDQTVWLRFEPFILHVVCISLSAASELVNATRPIFKNVGLTTWNRSKGRYLVAVWGDEGLDMPLCSPTADFLFGGREGWLAEMVNKRHDRNWAKIDALMGAIKGMGVVVEEEPFPKKFDVIGDVALLHTLPAGSEDHLKDVGDAVLKTNKALKLCVARTTPLTGTSRAPTLSGLLILSSKHPPSRPLITTHIEHGIQCVVDLPHTFFSPRMSSERIRIRNRVSPRENVLVLFAGVGIEAFHIAAGTEARSILAVESNERAVFCLERGLRMLERNKAVEFKLPNPERRIRLRCGDVLEVCPTLTPESFDRILAPRPKMTSTEDDTAPMEGIEFLKAFLPLLRVGGVCHWYDFVPYHELPNCLSTKRKLENACRDIGYPVEVIEVANCGSVAMKQFRVCFDFRRC